MSCRQMISGFSLLLLFAISAVISGCGGGGATAGNVTPDPLAVSPSAAVAYNGNPVTLYISGGTKPYTVTSSDSSVINVPNSVADATVVFDASNVPENTPVTLTVRDFKGVTTVSAITVKPAVINNNLTVTPDPAAPGVGCGTAVCSGLMATVSVQLKNMATPLVNRNVRFDVVQGNFQFITNSGATTFADTISTTTDQNGNAHVRLRANVNAPTQYAILKVTDVDGGSVLQTTFTIAQYTDGTGILSVVPDTQTITAYYKGECSSGVRVDYIIHGGTPPYTVQSTSTMAATVSPNTVLTNGAGFTATTQNGLCPGTAIIDIRDASGRVIQATLKNLEGTNTVTPPVTVAFFTTAPAAVTLTTTTPTASFTIGGGTPPYYASSSNTAVATASIAGTTLTLTRVATGSANITVADSVGATKTIAVTVP
ncbi:MAG: hypothetical protein ACYC2E_17580 [Sulfuricella sp.]